MDAYERFHRLLKRDFSPLLRADGFKGSGNTFRRVKGDRIDVVNVQGSRYGGECCVNVAVHFSFLPSEGGGRVTDPNEFKEYDCTFRDRLHEASESDHWWTYGASDAEAGVSVASLIDMYRRRGALFFGKFDPFPDVFERITPAEMDAGDLSKMPAAMTGVYAALTMARVMEHLGRREKCREFAEVGLRHLGHAVGLKAELERLRDPG
jgi:hypothetical protein